MKKDETPKVKECHCGSIANKYRTRIFINQLNYKVYRSFYRCQNCFSRINEDFSPELDAMPTKDAYQLIKLHSD